VVGPNARLRYVCGQGLSERAWVFGTQRAVVDQDGSLDWVALGFGSARGRVRMETQLRGAGAGAKVTGAYAGRGRQHLDFDTTQEHAAPNTTSDLAFRGVLGGRATAVWRGMIKVDPGAQGTDAFQESRNLLLSKRAHADAIPALEIEANDVRCTHAAAIQRLPCSRAGYAPDLLARVRGNGEGRILLLGHVDTVHGHDSHRPLERRGDRLFGSGTVDMKGGVVLALGTLESLARRPDAFAELALLQVTDEEWRVGGLHHAPLF